MAKMKITDELINNLKNNDYNKNQKLEILRILWTGHEIPSRLNSKYDAMLIPFVIDDDMFPYLDKGFNLDQLCAIEDGISKLGVENIKLYADPKFNADQMEAIISGLKKGYDVDVYADPKFSANKMRHILEFLNNDIDMNYINIITNPDLSDAQTYYAVRVLIAMKESRHIPDTFDINKIDFTALSLGQISEVADGLYRGIDMTQYLSFDVYQMREIEAGLKSGIDVSIYTNPNIDHICMLIIRNALENGIDGEEVRKMANPDYDWIKMLEIYKDLMTE